MIETDIELLKGIANQLRIHSITSTTAAGSGHPTSCCSAADIVATLFFGHMRYDAKNPHYLQQRPVHFVEGPRRAVALRRVGGNGLVSRGRVAEAAQIHLRPRRPSDAAAAVRGRGDRLARPGLERRRGHGARRAARQTGLQHLRPARRRRNRRRLGLGGREHRGHLQAEQSHRHRGRQPPRPEPGHGVRPRHRRLCQTV